MEPRSHLSPVVSPTGLRRAFVVIADSRTLQREVLPTLDELSLPCDHPAGARQIQKAV